MFLPPHHTQGQPNPSDSAIYPGVSEFGRHIAHCLHTLPLAKGGVLTDDLGDPIDFAYRPRAVASIDIQLCGAQLTQVVHQLGASTRSLGMPMQLLMVEAWGGTLVTSQLLDEYLLVLLMAPKADLSQAVHAFEALAQALLPLLA